MEIGSKIVNREPHGFFRGFAKLSKILQPIQMGVKDVQVTRQKPIADRLRIYEFTL